MKKKYQRKGYLLHTHKKKKKKKSKFPFSKFISACFANFPLNLSHFH